LVVSRITGTAQAENVGEEGDKERRKYQEAGGDCLTTNFIICTGRHVLIGLSIEIGLGLWLVWCKGGLW
jgi:hypothetical protein